MKRVIIIKFRNGNPTDHPLIAADWEIAEHLAVWHSNGEGFIPSARYEVINKSGLRGVVYCGNLKKTGYSTQLELMENDIQDNVIGEIMEFHIQEDQRFYEDWREQDGYPTGPLKQQQSEFNTD